MVQEHVLEERLQNFEKTCQEGGLRLTPQKIEVFKILAKTDAHPSAQEIFEAVKERFPKISFATVYDNLRKFKNLELIREIEYGGNSVRFDANLCVHHHVLKEETGEIFDVSLPDGKKIPIPTGLQNLQIKDIKITYII